MKNFFKRMYSNATTLNRKNILSLFIKHKNAKFLDLGCDDGKLSNILGRKIGTENISGVEIVESRIEQAVKNGLEVYNFDLNKKFHLEDNSFDVVHANQVIEHLYDSDNFLSEIHRVLRPGGYAIISTENASSWCNVFASIMGWQIFSLTNFSNKKMAIGNPLALHRGEEIDLKSWNHVRIYNIRGLKEYCEIFGFTVEKIVGAGYFPLPAIFGNVDRIHAHFITFRIKKI